MGETIRAWIGAEAVESTIRDSLGVAFLANGARRASRVAPETPITLDEQDGIILLRENAMARPQPPQLHSVE
jgi:hypothetical protein